MTISSVDVTSGPYTGTNTTDTYSYDFPIKADGDLAVYETDLFGTQTLLTLTTDYTVTGAGDAGGGTVVLTAGNLATGHKLYIRSDRDYLQEEDFVTAGSFLAENHERGLDHLAMLIQQIYDRTLLTPKGQTVSLANRIFPVGSENKFLSWDASGNLTALAIGTLSFDVTIGSGDAGKPVGVNGTEDGVEVIDVLPTDFVTTNAIADDAVDLDKIDSTSVYPSQAEAEAGTENTKLMTALRTKQAIDALGPQVTTDPGDDTDNTTYVTPKQLQRALADRLLPTRVRFDSSSVTTITGSWNALTGIVSGLSAAVNIRSFTDYVYINFTTSSGALPTDGWYLCTTIGGDSVTSFTTSIAGSESGNCEIYVPTSYSGTGRLYQMFTNNTGTQFRISTEEIVDGEDFNNATLVQMVVGGGYDSVNGSLFVYDSGNGQYFELLDSGGTARAADSANVMVFG